MKFTPDSKFMILCTRLVELTKINLLRLLGCLPIFTAGAATTAMNLLPVLLPQVFVLLGFVWLVCGFALMGWYDITVIEKSFTPYRISES